MGQVRSKAASLLLAIATVLAPAGGGRCAGELVTSFRYEDVVSLDDMKALIRREDPMGTPREAVRAAFVTQGGGTLKLHPTRPGVEKYLYDINLCRYYVWRWNISADYDGAGRLTQMYVNGEAALGGAAPVASAPKPAPGGRGRLIVIAKPRPEADKGERRLMAEVFQFADGEQRLIGAGPTRADPANLGRLHAYVVEPWRSIFDADAADRIVPYAGDCAAADAAQARAKVQALPPPPQTGPPR